MLNKKKKCHRILRQLQHQVKENNIGEFLFIYEKHKDLLIEHFKKHKGIEIYLMGLFKALLQQNNREV